MRWPLWKKVGFRFLFVYLVLYFLPLPPPWISDLIIAPAGQLLGVNARFRMNGSGDTPFHYVELLCILAASFAGAILWSVLDRKRENYHRLYLGLRVFLRLCLGAILLQYGAGKVIQTQFPTPSPHRLQETFGDSSPMGLLWTFMGVSRSYNAITGAVEMLAGALLFFTRTALLGSLLSIVVMAQIVALNFCYDVPVKIFSSHLFAVALFLAADDAPRLAGIFLLNRAVMPASQETLIQRKILRQSGTVLKLAFLTTIVATFLYTTQSFRKQLKSGPQPDPARFPLLNRGFHWINEGPYNR